MSFLRAELDVRSYGARGDGITDDSAAFERTVSAARALGGASVRLPPLIRFSRALAALPTDVSIRVLGSKTTVYHGDHTVFQVIDCQTSTSARHIFDGLKFVPDTMYTGNPFYIENSGGQRFDNIGFRYVHTAFDLHNRKAGDFSEGNVFLNVEGKGYVYGWRYRKTAGDASFADQHFYRCKISADRPNDPGQASYGLHIGTGCSLYRSFFGNVTFFPETLASVGLYCDGDIQGATGSINIEGDARGLGAGQTVGFWFGPNASSTASDLYSHLISVDVPVLKDTSCTADITIRSLQAGAANGGIFVAAPQSGDSTILRAYFAANNTGGGTKVEQHTLQANLRVVEQQYDVKEVRKISDGKLGTYKAHFVRDTATDTAGGTPDVTDLGRITLNPSSSVNYTGFSGGQDQQEVVVNYGANATNATLVHGAAFRLQGGVNYAGTANGYHKFVKVGSTWVEISRNSL